MVLFDPRSYGGSVADILNLEGGGQRLMPLTGDHCISAAARDQIRECGAAHLFPGARAAEAAISGLFVYCGCWSEAHETAQQIDTPEGSYWHAIVHRQEPDAWNSGYWLRQVGTHAIFPALHAAALQIGVETGPQWRPEAFIEFCEKARQRPGSELERQARQVQLVEWQLLFDYCARAD